jgi:hypothetical protein
MSDVLLIGLMTLAMVVFPVYKCALSHYPEISPKRFILATFIPMTRKDFWFPPCPLCWGVRAVVVTTGVLFVVT